MIIGIGDCFIISIASAALESDSLYRLIACSRIAITLSISIDSMILVLVLRFINKIQLNFYMKYVMREKIEVIPYQANTNK